MVLVTKYRKPVLDGKIKDLVYTTIQDIFKEKRTCNIRNERRM
ncbi:MAG: hypothetical protein ACLTS6_11320 [Anaerobutyricum sp.]